MFQKTHNLATGRQDARHGNAKKHKLQVQSESNVKEKHASRERERKNEKKDNSQEKHDEITLELFFLCLCSF